MKSIIILLFLSIQTVFSGFERQGLGARNSALAFSSNPVTRDVWAVRTNPGGLALIESASLGVDYEPAPFGMGELRIISAAVAIPSAVGNFGLAAGAFGYSLYRESSLSITYGQNIGGFGLGMRANYYSVSIERYGHSGSITFDAGVLIPIFPSLTVGFSINNFGNATIGSSGEKLPQSFLLGASLTPFTEAALFCTYTKETGFAATTRFGVEYSFLEHVALRAGIDGEPALMCGGIGLRWSGIGVDYSLTHHDDLGWTQEISISFSWGGRDD